MAEYMIFYIYIFLKHTNLIKYGLKSKNKIQIIN